MGNDNRDAGTMLTLDQIRSAADLPERVVEVPEWGGAVRMRGLSAADGIAVMEKIQGADGKPDNEKAMVYAVLMGVVEPKFSEADMEWLKAKSLKAMTRITKVFNELSGFGAAELAEAKNA